MMSSFRTVALLLSVLAVDVAGVALRGQPADDSTAADVGFHAAKGKGWGEDQEAEHIRPFDPKASWHPTYGELSYNHDGFTEDWQTEWRRGDFPTWKDMHPKIKPFEERQSDGVPSPPGR